MEMESVQSWEGSKMKMQFPEEIDYGQRDPNKRTGLWYIVKTVPRQEQMVIRRMEILRDENPLIDEILEIQLPYAQYAMQDGMGEKLVEKRSTAPYIYIRVKRSAIHELKFLLAKIDGVREVYETAMMPDEVRKCLSFDEYSGWGINPGDKVLWINLDNIGIDWFGTVIEKVQKDGSRTPKALVKWKSARGRDEVSVKPISKMVKVGYKFD